MVRNFQMHLNSLSLRGKLLPPIPLAFRIALYNREQMAYDPYVGLKNYGPYKAVNVKVLHLIPKKWSRHLPSELTRALTRIISNILDTFLKKSGKRIEIEDEYINDIEPTISGDENKRRRTVENLVSIIDYHKGNVVLMPIPRSILGDYRSNKLYAKIKAIGLREGFITQFYSDDKVLTAVKKLTEKSKKPILLNLALNIFAKAGGIPWALHNELKYDVIIGLSWSLRRSYGLTTGPTVKCYGVIHTFSNIGVWEKFKSFICESKEDSIFKALQETLDFIAKIDIVRRKTKYNRVLIMTREPLKEEFIKKLSDYLVKNYGYYMDVALISTHMPLRLYDLGIRTYLAPRGLYFLESEESAYVVTTGRIGMKYTGIGVPKPIRVRILYCSDEKIKALTRALTATYALTSMNWRSFWGSLRVPTTIHYSKVVARLFSIMDEEDIERSFAKHGKYVYKPLMYEDKPWFI